MLFETQHWVPTYSGTQPRLSAQDDRALRDWQFRHLRLSWVVTNEPWRVEDEVISMMKPPLNVARNAHHPFYEQIKAARERFRASSRTT